MLSFNLSSGKVVLDPYTLMIKEIVEIVEAHRNNPDEGIRILTYIHIASRIDPKAPFFEAKADEVKALAARNTWRGQPVEVSQWDNAIEAYKRAFEGPEARVVTIFNDKIDQIIRLIANTTPEIKSYTTNAGTEGFSTNTTYIIRAMNDLDSLLDAKDRLQARMQKNTLTEGKIQGKKTPSRLEKSLMQADGTK